MNILEIDAGNFAGRVAHVAAAELAGLLNHGDIRPEVGWFAGELGAEAGEALGERIDTMAEYALKRLCSGETLYRAHGGTTPWGNLEPWVRDCYDLFAVTVAGIGSKLLVRQQNAERQRAVETFSKAIATPLEDTIFEKEEGLGAQRPEAKEAQKLIAQADQAKKREARAKRKAQEAQERQAKAAGKAADKPDPSTPPAPMSAGEPPAKPPVNRGGRGRRKPAGKGQRQK